MNVTLFFVRAINPLKINGDVIKNILTEKELMDRFAQLWVRSIEEHADYSQKYVYVYNMAIKDDVTRYQDDENDSCMSGRWCYASTNPDILAVFSEAVKRHEKKKFKVRIPYHTFVEIDVVACNEDEARRIAEDKEWDYLPEEVDQLTSHLQGDGDIKVEKITD